MPLGHPAVRLRRPCRASLSEPECHSRSADHVNPRPCVGLLQLGVELLEERLQQLAVECYFVARRHACASIPGAVPETVSAGRLQIVLGGIVPCLPVVAAVRSRRCHSFSLSLARSSPRISSSCALPRSRPMIGLPTPLMPRSANVLAGSPPCARATRSAHPLRSASCSMHSHAWRRLFSSPPCARLSSGSPDGLGHAGFGSPTSGRHGSASPPRASRSRVSSATPRRAKGAGRCHTTLSESGSSSRSGPCRKRSGSSVHVGGRYPCVRQTCSMLAPTAASQTDSGQPRSAPDQVPPPCIRGALEVPEVADDAQPEHVDLWPLLFDRVRYSCCLGLSSPGEPSAVWCCVGGP